MTDNIRSAVHWSALAPDEQIRFWQEVDAGKQDSFLVPTVKKLNIQQNPNAKTRPGIALSIIKSLRGSLAMPTTGW